MKTYKTENGYQDFQWFTRIKDDYLRKDIVERVDFSDETLSMSRNWAPLEVYRPFFSEKEEKAFVKILNDPNNPGMSDVGTRNMLFSLITSTNPSLVVEIGAHVGMCSLVIGCALRACGRGHLVTIEPNDIFYSSVSGYLSEAGLSSTVSVLKGYSYEKKIVEFIKRKGPITLLYIDAVHEFEAVCKELELYFPLLVNGGMVVLHDTSAIVKSFDSTGKGGVRQAVWEFAGKTPDFLFTSLDWPAWLHPCGLVIATKCSEK